MALCYNNLFSFLFIAIFSLETQTGIAGLHIHNIALLVVLLLKKQTPDNVKRRRFELIIYKQIYNLLFKKVSAVKHTAPCVLLELNTYNLIISHTGPIACTVFGIKKLTCFVGFMKIYAAKTQAKCCMCAECGSRF